MKLEAREKFAAFSAVASFLVFALLLKFSSLSVGSLVNVPNTFIKSFISGSGDTFSAVAALVAPFTTAVLALVFFTLSFSFLAAYGYFTDNKKFGAAVGAINAVIVIAVLQSIVGAFIGIAVFVVSAYIIPLSNTYGKELERWIKFRVGSNSISKALMIINLLVAIGVLAAVMSNSAYYEAGFKLEMKQSIRQAVSNSISVQNQPLAAQLQPQIDAEIDKQVDKALASPIFVSYFNWLPVIAALSIYVAMEFLRNIVLSNIGGLFTYVLISMESSKNEKK